VFDKEYRIVRQTDQATRWVHGRGKLEFDAQGQPVTMRGVIRDITERKRAMQELEESEARFRTFFEQNGSVMLLLEPSSGAIVNANEAAAEFYGYSRQQLTSMRVDQINTLPREEIALERERALSEARTRFNFRHRLASGEIRDVEVYASPMTVDDRPILFSIVHDVSERTRAEAQLRDSEERYRATFEQAAVGIVHTGLDGHILRCNARFAEIVGYLPHELKGRTFQQLTLPEDLEDSLHVLRKLSKGEIERITWEKRYIRKDGSFTWVKLTISTQCDNEGRPRHYITVVEDINARKAAEQRLDDAIEALRASEERYRATFQMSIDAININRLSDGVFVDCNEAFLRFTGCKREDVIGRTSRELNFWVNPADRQKWVEALRRDSNCKGLEARFRRKNGEIVWGEASGTLIEANGVPCILSVTRDVTAAKAADDMLVATMGALRVSEERYRTTFQMSMDVISINRMGSGEYVDVNHAFTLLGGYRREEAIGRTSEELGIWADVRDRERMSETIRRHGICRDLEAQFRKKNGDLFWGLLSASVIEIDGKPCLLSVTRDISPAKAADARIAAVMKALQASEAHYRTVFQTSVDGIVVSQLHDGRYIDANNAFLTLMGYEREDVIGRTSLELNFWSNPEARTEMVDSLSQNQKLRDVETQFIRKNGERIWILVSATVMEIEGLPCILSVVRDISAAKAAKDGLAAAQRALEASEERYRTAFQTSLDSININRLRDGCYIDCNQAFLDSVGYTRDEVIGRTSIELNIWANPRDRQNLVDMLTQTGSCRDLEGQFRRKNGEVFWGQMSASMIESDGVPCILSISRDISSAKVAEDEIRTLAFYDPLTHLPNRRLVSERLRQSLAASARSNHKGALLFFDVDNFKTLNDTLGHKTGDLLLQEIARRLSACIREADTVARLGGDEFVVILEDLSGNQEEAAAQAKMVSEKILASVCQPFVLAGRECLSTSSIGITVFGDRTDTIDDVLQQADIAMYQAKAAGRNTLRFFAPALQAAINTRAAMEDELRQAIGTGQIEVYYQPQVQSGALIGAEALLRWIHPQRGFLPPMDFIPLAEETGLILPLGNWVLETACRQIASWSQRQETAHITVAVNISARQLRQPDFVDQVLGALERAGANPRNLDLELTESMLLDNIDEVIAKMTALKSHGLRFSLDDFGTGYSSLSYLKRLPLDQLKIDRAFVHDMLVDVTSGAIAQTVISLSKAMGLAVMAEGVETEQQRDFLASLGCHTFQGFLFSPPLSLKEFEMLLPAVAEGVVSPPSIH
jgi:diguanylate cyclase (GGDEF)-like protein/PAS domain S-box-containing protein